MKFTEFTQVSMGLGIDSVAMTIELFNRKIPFNIVLFADTKVEHARTYRYKAIFSDWLISNNLPEVITVQSKVMRPSDYWPIKGEPKSLYKDCWDKRILPSICYGNSSLVTGSGKAHRSCSDKFKQKPMYNYLKNMPRVQYLWGEGKKITRLIGFSKEEGYRSFRAPVEDKRFINRYPLQEWGYSREDCIQIIKDAGLPNPQKSSCTICGAMHLEEIVVLRNKEPKNFQRAIQLEQRAVESGKLTRVKGLGNNRSWQQMLKEYDQQLRLF